MCDYLGCFYRTTERGASGTSGRSLSWNVDQVYSFRETKRYHLRTRTDQTEVSWFYMAFVGYRYFLIMKLTMYTREIQMEKVEKYPVRIVGWMVGARWISQTGALTPRWCGWWLHCEAVIPCIVLAAQLLQRKGEKVAYCRSRRLPGSNQLQMVEAYCQQTAGERGGIDEVWNCYQIDHTKKLTGSDICFGSDKLSWQ